MSNPHDPLIARPAGDPNVLTTADAQALQKALAGLATQVDTFNQRLAGGERRWMVLTVLSGVIVIVLGVVIWLGIHVNTVSACQARQNDAFRASSQAARVVRDQQDRRQVTLIDQQGAQLDQQLDLFNKLGPDSTTDERVAATVAYRNKVMASKAANLSVREAIITGLKTRADNPLPDGNCG